MPDITHQLARYVAESALRDIPEELGQEARRALLNWLGCALGGAHDATVTTLLNGLGDCSGPPQATVVGRGEQHDILTVACVNAVASNILDFDDTHLPTVIHPTAPVAAALLALGEHIGLDGNGFQHALILGIEVECRIGNALSPALFDAGWHPTAVCGGVGAAAACSKALGLSAEGIAQALGLAATQACGLNAVFGTMAKSYNIGQAARSGLVAAKLAAAGVTAGTSVLESPRGLLDVHGGLANAEEAVTGLGVSWQLSAVAYKAYPCGIVTHAAIDGCLDLRAGQLIQDISAVEIVVDPVTFEVCGHSPAPATGLQAKLSLHYCAAVALLDGEVGVGQFSDARLNDESVHRLARRVNIAPDKALSKGQARVNIRLEDGSRRSADVKHARGSLERPLTDAELDRKFSSLAQSAKYDPETITDLMAFCRSVHELPDIGVLARSLPVTTKKGNGHVEVRFG